MHHTAGAVSVLFALACASAPNAPGGGSGPHQHVEIQFDDMAILPETADPQRTLRGKIVVE